MHAIEDTRVLVEMAAFRVWSSTTTEKAPSPTRATRALTARVVDGGVLGGDKLCQDSKVRLEALVGTKNEADRVERGVCEELESGVYADLTRYFDGLSAGFSIATGPLPTRLRAALLLLKAQELGGFDYDVTFLDESGTPLYVLHDANVYVASTYGTSASSISAS